MTSVSDPLSDPLAVAVMTAYCGWDPTTVVTETVQLDGSGTALLTLPSLYVTDVAAVTVTDGYGTTKVRTVDTAATLTVGDAPTADVGWSQNGCLTWRGYSSPGWPSGQRNVTVTYTGGYPFPPDDLVAALASVARRTSGAMGVASRRMGTAAVSFGAQYAAGGLLMVEEMVFDRYRILKAA